MTSYFVFPSMASFSAEKKKNKDRQRNNNSVEPLLVILVLRR